MRIFAEKTKATQQNSSAKSSIPGRAYFGQSPEVRSIPHLQRAIGNQAVQPMLQTHAEEPEARSTAVASPRFAHDFSQIPVHPKLPVKIQAKLAVNTSGDIYEQEADRVAEQVMRVPNLTRVADKSPSSMTSLVQRGVDGSGGGMATMKGCGPTRAPGSAIGYGDGPSLHGRTQGTFDQGKKKIDGLKTSPATGCDCPAGQPCLRAVGTMVVTYKVKVTITMPPMPSGLSKCKQNRVAAFLKNVLRPHEEEHKRRFETYNGITRRPIEARGCGQDEAKRALDTEAQRMHDEESAAREAEARRKSDAIDPFFSMIDFEGCQ